MDAVSPAVDSIRILAVDDHPVFRSGIAALLATQPDMSLVAVASTGREAIEQFRSCHPDITLMDLQMREMDDLEPIIAIRREFPEARVIVLTRYSGDVQVLRAKVGARAYLLKTCWIKSYSRPSVRFMRGRRRFPLKPLMSLPSTRLMTA